MGAVKDQTPADDYKPYVVSDERLAEIRAMFTDRDEQDAWRLEAAPGVTMDDLLGAVYDLLGERDDRRFARPPWRVRLRVYLAKADPWWI